MSDDVLRLTWPDEAKQRTNQDGPEGRRTLLSFSLIPLRSVLASSVTQPIPPLHLPRQLRKPPLLLPRRRQQAAKLRRLR